MKSILALIITLCVTAPVFSQNMGIDQPNPSEKLDVNGNIKANAIKFPDGSTQSKAGKVVATYHATTAATRQTISSATPQSINGLSITITPKSASSKFMIMAVVNGSHTYVASSLIYRNGAKILNHGNHNNEPGSQATIYIGTSTEGWMNQQTINYLDAPNTTSTVTYNVRHTSAWAGGVRNSHINDRSSNDMRTPSTLTIIEFAD